MSRNYTAYLGGFAWLSCIEKDAEKENNMVTKTRKRIFALLTALTLMASLNVTAFAAGTGDVSTNTNEVSSVMPRAAVVVAEDNGYNQSGNALRGSFTLSGTRNIKIIFWSDNRSGQNPVLKIYNSLGIWVATKVLQSGGTSSTTYDVATGLWSGKYTYTIGTGFAEDYNYVYKIVSTEYI